ncbi:hypothetical protein CFOL_v3_09199 [Cephalotus follicularis]|uniref:Protein RIK n=1 Tax=Cephalotus follicularis TaxID=3775 RepID=A0A1Q3BCQ8_CEPFO|nr:hypothetical protein CFOL_v3_09199 [Cephalotus follicularis]
MTEDGNPRVFSDESAVSNDASQTRQRKKRKWDQPADSLVSAGVSLPGILSTSLGGISLPGIFPVSGALLTNSLVASCATVPSVIQTPLIQQNPSVMVSKLNQTKIQDELIIAREIVINDAEASVRYKLTKRQTQEEIQKCTGAVVITRGKYRPPNAPVDGEKPLYLHISAGAHIKDTTERILAVDRAAAMVEEMLKQGLSLQPTLSALSNGLKVTMPLSTCVLLGFEADPSLNISARIRGPNDQYINHIMNETGATVLLRGRGSGNIESQLGEEVHQQLHLFLSSNNPKSLEDAKLLAENLMDTISVECGMSRISSCKIYNAVPPPQQLLAGVQSTGNEQNVDTSTVTGMASTLGLTSMPAYSATVPGVPSVYPQASVSQSAGMVNCGQPQPLLTGGTSYNGYGGIYPQATPLQQVALALRQSPSPITSTVAPTNAVVSTASKSSTSSISHKEKRPPQKRKFQEQLNDSKGPANPHQGLEVLNRSEPSLELDVRNVSTMPAPKKWVQASSYELPPPPQRTMLPPPPPPKFASTPVKLHDKNNILNKARSQTVPDTLVKLMEYGEEDDDLEETGEEPVSSNSTLAATRKPFWAV